MMKGIGALLGKPALQAIASGSRRGATRTAPAAKPPQRKLLSKRINFVLLRRIAFVFALVIGAGLLLEGWQKALPQVNQPISRIIVKGDLSQEHQDDLEQLVEPYVSSKFFSLEIAALQQSLEQVDWVNRASIRRVWPDQLAIEVQEQKPMARWGEEHLLNERAHVFSKEGVRDFAALPYLSGPEQSQAVVIEHYQLLSERLRPMGYTIDKLELRERGSWFLTTQDGLELLLGRDQLLEKMRRFSTVYEKELKGQMNQVARIDLRYANGLAVTWRGPENAAIVQ